MRRQATSDITTACAASPGAHAFDPASTRDAWFDHPLFAGIAADREIFLACTRGELDGELPAEPGARPLRFVAQTDALLADGLHYEERIARGVIATREANTHDAFNALVWLRHRSIKQAMNARQVADIARVGPKRRTRGQCALTHFDEAGAIVWIDGSDPVGPDLVEAWNAHDWHALFAKHRDAWGRRIALTVIGHALFDYALEHRELPVAKALAVRVDRSEIAASSRHALIAAWPEAEVCVADAIATGRLLADPQELRPLPLVGIPGWQVGAEAETFLATAPCFRPLRPGRLYPEPSDHASLSARGGLENAFRPAVIGPRDRTSR